MATSEHTLTFRGLDRGAYTRLCGAAAQHGLDITPLAPAASVATGRVSSHGCTVQYTYSAQAGVLTCTLVSKPWLFSEAMVLGRLQSTLAEAIRQAESNC